MSTFPFKRLQAELAVLISRTPAGARLPSEPVLAKKMGVSRATLREAMRTFETQGMIRRRQGAGTFVVGQVPVLTSGLEILESLDMMAARLGLEVSASALHIESIYADQEYAEGLNIPLASKLTCVRRVILADERPVAFLVDTLPEDVLQPQQLPDYFNGSVLDFLLKRDVALTVSRAEISAVGATPEIARALEIQRGDVLLQFRSQLYVADGRVVDYSVSNFIPGYFNFHVVRRVDAFSTVVNGQGK
jgi:GntR family transcriptional regulator